MAALYTLVSVIIISLLSLSGALALLINRPLLKSLLLVLVALSTGALLGDSFLHLLPEAVDTAGEFSSKIALLVFLGLLIFFVLEKFLRWRHCHDVECSDHTPLGTMNLVGDGIHNFIDGLLIGASYLISLPLGIATTVAVALHEIPQELGDFGVLLHSGFKPAKAILYNLLSALLAVGGGALALLLGTEAESKVVALIPITAGGFIYIALSGLVPELHKEQRISRSLLQLLAIGVGVALMYGLLFLES